MKSVHYVDEYIQLYKSKKIKFNKERKLLIRYLEKHILTRDDLYFDEELIENFIRFAEKWYFPLQPFQKFIICFVFLFYKEDDSVFYEQFFFTMGRGAGKNGLISALAHFFISPLHGIQRYNVSIVANTEKQAKMSFTEIYDTIEGKETLEDSFHKTKVEIQGIDTRSIIQYHTSNADSKDGLRDGCVIYDEIHRYETSNIVNVFSSGLGKVPNAREFFIGTNGYVREGFFDKLVERSMNILEGKDLNDPLFPFICKLDDAKEVDDQSNWEKANPMFSKPMSLYAKQSLYKKVLAQYRQLENNPTNREEFMTKRMNLPEVDLGKSVASWKDILATNRPFPDLKHRVCVGGLDFASIKDFAAVGLLFKVGDEYVWKTHSFVRQGFLDSVKLKITPKLKEWEHQGLLTIVDEPVIDVKNIVNWFVEMREQYGLTKIVADTFRLDLVRTALEAEGFELEFVRNPRAIHSLLAPKVETMFAKHKVIFDDNPLMRWYVNNVLVKTKKDGNKEYLKKDEFRRKTDGFQAFIHSLFKADEILVDDADFFLDSIAF
ncbi:terminase TerL endonuclease subunit [Fictibacillus fluitans]|uniref:Terminase large subunit n=1 Tax=Fictibacillus fluitans TaxID=3058422 RepID=A0ABT8HX36_9BACL|nr:terminase TerL endonuclease subunit [Fictibacillus sp. NE201]MDN4525330.1 terminase large subunit [Fictibacillus sp. NE201]